MTLASITSLLLGALISSVLLLLDFVWAGLFWLAWTHYGIGQYFFPWLPPQFIAPDFWHIFGLFICLSVIKHFSPLNISSQSTTK